MFISRELVQEVAKKLRGSLQGPADRVVAREDGQRWWLRLDYDPSGVQVGVTACCLEDEPCAWHRAIGKKPKALLDNDSGGKE